MQSLMSLHQVPK